MTITNGGHRMQLFVMEYDYSKLVGTSPPLFVLVLHHCSFHHAISSKSSYKCHNFRSIGC